ncbi:MAG: PTS sugar transporter subunit IIC [Brevinema sp.]
MKFIERYSENISLLLARYMGSFFKNRYITILKDGIVANLMPALIGSFFLLIVALPIPGYPEFMTSVFGEEWNKYPLLVVDVSMGLMGIIAVLSISFRMAESFEVFPLPPVLIAFMSYLLLTPQIITQNMEVINGVIPVTFLGSRGLFTAIIVGLVVTRLYVFIVEKKFVIKMPNEVPPTVSGAFLSIIPGFIVLTMVLFFRYLIDISPYENIHVLVMEFIVTPISSVGTNFFGLLFYVFLLHFLWFFGIHGGLVVGALWKPLFLLIADQNRLAYQNGEPILHLMTEESLNFYVFLGGSGASLPLIIVLFFFAKSTLYKNVARLSIIPGLFNINETLVFGMPVVFNPKMLIPWLFIPIVNYLIAYLVTLIGWVQPYPGVILPWTTPIIISGFLIGGIPAVLLQIFNFMVSAFLWYCFVHAMDKEQYQLEQL